MTRVFAASWARPCVTHKRTGSGRQGRSRGDAGHARRGARLPSPPPSHCSSGEGTSNPRSRMPSSEPFSTTSTRSTLWDASPAPGCRACGRPDRGGRGSRWRRGSASRPQDSPGVTPYSVTRFVARFFADCRGGSGYGSRAQHPAPVRSCRLSSAHDDRDRARAAVDGNEVAVLVEALARYCTVGQVVGRGRLARCTLKLRHGGVRLAAYAPARCRASLARIVALERKTRARRAPERIRPAEVPAVAPRAARADRAQQDAV